ncbi:imidazole glycerol phosphate synthase subunit HisH [Methylophilaceae bacterium]|jgi:glutamine amidotransferase|nr:imidazole glycerol phosphate synthase subunit HisH [Methylophilaceae bacterium]|tara:strand:- start:6425 stop:7042 length:618 start_codon:yes stop_codon:yes gene_type:complete
MIAIIDYGIGNLKSVHNAVSFISPQTKSIVTSDPDIVSKADKVIFPGQGAMPDCILQLNKRGLKGAVIEAAKEKPFLGICLGLQMLFETSEEGDVEGFGLLPGAVKRFQLNKNERIKIPHMGWNKVHLSTSHPLWNKIDSDSRFYFVHSFYAEVANKNLVMATSTHGEEFTCAIAKDNVFAVQFHPEKSSKLGLQLLKNFISWNI